MSSTKLIVVIGATGLQGGSVVDTMRSDPNWRIRGVTRNLSSSKSQALASKGVELVQAELNDVASLIKAFEGAHAIFSVTDFWAIYSPENMSKLKPGQALNEYAFEQELKQGKNVFDAAAKVPTLEKLLFSSLANVKKISGGKYDKSLHFDSKALAVEYGKVTYPELWKKTSIIQLGVYLSNFSRHPWLTPKKNEETELYEFSFPIGNGKSPMVAAEEDTGPLTRALLAAPAGQNLAAYREWMGIQEFVDLWSKTLGVKGSVSTASITGMPAELDEEIEHTFKFASEFGYFGHSVDKTLVDPHELDPKLRLGTVEEWIKAQDWSHVIKA